MTIHSNRNSVTRTQINAIATLGVTLMSTIVFSASAYASEQHTYPGSICDATSSVGAALLDKYAGRALNTSSSQTINYVVCPIVRDVLNSSTIGPKAYIRVKNTKNVTTTCWLESINSDGGYFDYQAKSLSGAGTSTLVIQLAASSTQSGRPYQLECSLPSGSSVLQYNVVEN
ncbi:hypothetical protein [Synechocystis sp. PCC 7509]|uniref:hypothetical protein n=1 Tax=Synechocystis sp. PCC 7509 TaxID=927677 RepID=UPI0002AC1839|nr:hypothetical protein [Synechocystis sp. PCC 7509]